MFSNRKKKKIAMTNYSAASLANGLLNDVFKANASVSAMKLQKLSYLLHGFALYEFRDDPEHYTLNERFEAWPFGPVLPSLYHECRLRSSGPIRKFLNGFDEITLSVAKTSAPLPSDNRLQRIIEGVWENFGSYSESYLSNITNCPKGAWAKALRDPHNLGYKNFIISHKAIRDAFSEVINGGRQQQPDNFQRRPRKAESNSDRIAG